MSTKKATKDTSTVDQLFVIGLDESGKPRGARFAENDDRVVSAALDMMLTCVLEAAPAAAELGMKLPRGRFYASGKAFVPNIRRALYDQLIMLLRTPNEGSQTFRLLEPPAGRRQAEADTQAASVVCISPSIAGLPRSWDAVAIGHMVLVHESAAEGWWEAVITARDDEVLTLRYRDFPKVPQFVRHISAVALVNPGPA